MAVNHLGEIKGIQQYYKDFDDITRMIPKLKIKGMSTGNLDVEKIVGIARRYIAKYRNKK